MSSAAVVVVSMNVQFPHCSQADSVVSISGRGVMGSRVEVDGSGSSVTSGSTGAESTVVVTSTSGTAPGSVGMGAAVVLLTTGSAKPHSPSFGTVPSVQLLAGSPS